MRPRGLRPKVEKAIPGRDYSEVLHCKQKRRSRRGGVRPDGDRLGLREGSGRSPQRRTSWRPGDGSGRDGRRLHWALEPGEHLPGNPVPPRTGDDAGLSPTKANRRVAPCSFGPSTVLSLTNHASPESKRSGGVLWRARWDGRRRRADVGPALVLAGERRLSKNSFGRSKPSCSTLCPPRREPDQSASVEVGGDPESGVGPGIRPMPEIKIHAMG